MSAALALTDPARLVASWRAGVLSLPDDQVPCPGMIWTELSPSGRSGVWRSVRKAMLAFIGDWGEAAADLGWSTEALFGVHRLAGASRADCTGTMFTVYPRRCIALCEREIHLDHIGGSVVVDRRHPCRMRADLTAREVRGAMIVCDDPKTTGSLEHVTCDRCRMIRTGAAGWTIARCRWFKSLDEARFYERHGRLPDPAPSVAPAVH
ncbi:hypothetical protein [Methylorubrum extorquens]|uniref:Uncharacterized protein n=1 Tax=Methylorubrum extorquens (strain CM4 / NCIMB 13688) TaxID=440085 RepID=B7KYQ0_METC4|nr:hypothetical protein [Methylorubrum extorquens]ACK84801.1 hypothetical protein Mchl_3996 [Methylorubrum extorquens CM4]